jgi:hypothetical protein
VRLDHDELQPSLQCIGRSLYAVRIDLHAFRGTRLQRGAPAHSKYQEARNHAGPHDPDNRRHDNHREISFVATRYFVVNSINKMLSRLTLMAPVWSDLNADGKRMSYHAAQKLPYRTDAARHGRA